jgi:uncharacterized protein (DUF2141 family)
MASHLATFLIGVCFWTTCLLESYHQDNTVSGISLAIDNLQSNEGNVHVAIYNEEEQFAKSLEPYRLKIYKAPASGQLKLQLDSLPYGRYALAIYHDENSNGDLDKNLLGIPKEPYGFSNNPRAKWSAPTYKETSFELGSDRAQLTVSLKKWKER